MGVTPLSVLLAPLCGEAVSIEDGRRDGNGNSLRCLVEPCRGDVYQAIADAARLIRAEVA